MSEEFTDNGKLFTISMADEHEANPILNMVVKTDIPEIFKVGQEDQIKIKWKNNANQDMQFTAYDEDGNGFIDHVEWVVPHLSTQTFEIIYIQSLPR